MQGVFNMIIGFFGNMCDGKTLNAVIKLKEYYDRGYVIYSNTWLSFPYVSLLSKDLIDIAEGKKELPFNCAMFIDEIHVWLDSRVSGSKKNRIISYFLLQTGKMGSDADIGLILIYTTQYYHQIDKRLRSTTCIAIECEKIKIHFRKIFKLNSL